MQDIVPTTSRTAIAEVLRDAIAEAIGGLIKSTHPDATIVIERLVVNVNVAEGGGASVNVIDGFAR